MLNEEDYNDIVAAAQLLTGIVGRHGQARTEREELKKNSAPTEI